MEDNTSVKVAVRIRPQIPREIIDMCHVCTRVAPGEPQVWIGKDKAFTFDQVFDMGATQEEVFESCVRSLVDGCFEGYNATVLAYGQTGSGKTYTMGTGLDINLGTAAERGIIPRAVEHLFSRIAELQREARSQGETPPEFKVTAQFMELYNEDIIDLLDPARESDERGRKSFIKIHEDAMGGIYTVGVTTRSVMTVDETLHCLKVGALSRTTASTQMNAQSSRSHAIFTILVKQQRIVKIEVPAQNGDVTDLSLSEESFSPDERGLNEFETLTAKFHFVDLAGSERLKRTGATGERAKEGISINCGLLALGNVISALGDKSRKVSHVPYRDSKLTRLLQDSLGGNSRTIMIACVSPSDRDFMETLNTLKYANRAKNIKNRVMVNQDKSSQTIAALRREIQQLQLELLEYKQGKRVVGEDGSEQVNDMFHENTMLQAENQNLRTRIKALQETAERLTARNVELLAERTVTQASWITDSESGEGTDMTKLIQGYIKEIEELRTKLMESEELCAQLRKQKAITARIPSSLHYSPESPSVYQLIDEAKRDVRKLKKKSKSLRQASEPKEKEAEGSEEDKEKAEDQENKEGSEPSDNQKTENDETSVSEMNGVLSSEEEDEEEDSSYSDEVEDNKENYSEDLAALTTEISIKQKLIEELELSQRRLNTMRQHYEEKLLQLQNKIRETEMERDRVLASLTKGQGPLSASATFGSGQSEEKVRRVREEFERKLSSLQNELKKLQSAKKEHTQLMKNQAHYEKQVRQLKQEVQDMKKAKVRLVQKMKEESAKHKEAEQRRTREIAQLRKEGRQRENRLRTLEAEQRAKEAVLRRRQEEVAALRKLARPAMSDRAAGRLPSSARSLSASSHYSYSRRKFSPRQAKLKWQQMEKNINQLALNKQTLYSVERDMERWLQEREKLSRCLERIIRKRDRAILEKKDEATIRDLEDQVENIKANVDYIHENITECQSSIVQMEEAKEDGGDPLDITALTANMDFEESKYLLQKLLSMAINQSIQAAQREASVKELEARLKQVAEHNSVQQELLQHVLHQANEDLYNILMNTVEQDKSEVGNGDSSRSPSPVDNSQMEMGLSTSTLTIDSTTRRDKARHKAVTKEELLYAGNSTSDLMVRSLVESGDKRDTVAGHRRVLASSQSFKELNSRSERRYLEQLSPAMRRKYPFTPPAISRHNSLETSCELTPPHSPPIFHRKDNVFSRLTSSSSIENRSRPDRGVIAPYTAKTVAHTKNSPLLCTHVADGHSKAVLSLAATDDVLFSGSKDRTVKIWDLHTGQEVQSLGGHPNNVVAVRYCEYTRLAFSVATAFIKVWDVRENPAHCVKTLCSSGLTNNGPVTTNTPSRVIQMPAGEAQIHDIALNHYGTTLFSAAGNIVRMWDLRMFHSVGKLSGGHQAAVMCLAVDELGMDNNLVVTGSKDHSIKVFEVVEGLGGVHTPKVNLDPPHYDGVQSLAIGGDFLFSGSRDMAIKKWDLTSASLVQSVNQAHKDWVCALTFLPRSTTLLLSSCRQGYVKLWSAESCQLMGEVRAHGANINSLATNSVCIFTASNDCTIGVWRVRSTCDLPSPDN